MTRGWRIGLSVVAAVVAVDLGLHFLGTLTGGTPGGPRSSSYATGLTGLGAYAELLGRRSHGIDRLRRTPHALKLDPSHTVVLFDPPAVATQDARTLRAFVLAGGRLIAGGGSMSWLAHLLAHPPGGAERGVRVAHRLAPAFAGVRTVRTAGDLAWRRGGETRALFGGRGRVVVADAGLGRGTVLLLADPSPLQNRLLGAADNAALGLALAGPAGRSVDFLETYHGYGRSTGLYALPLSWKLLLGGLGVSALVYLIARGRRFGPPEPVGRELPPPRSEYVDSLAAVVARTRRPDDAVAAVRRRARETLLSRAALPRDSEDDAVVAAAQRLGVAADDAAALVRPARSDADVLAVGRALARIGQDRPR